MQHRILIIACLTLLSLNCLSQEEKFESVHVENKIVFKGNIGSVWVYLSNLGNLQNLVPSTIKHSVLESKDEGSIVTLTLQNGSRIIEKVTDINHKKKMLK